MMNKTKAEIEQMASFICREKGQYMFNKKEIGIITGLCKDKVAELCENIPAAWDGYNDGINAEYPEELKGSEHASYRWIGGVRHG